MFQLTNEALGNRPTLGDVSETKISTRPATVWWKWEMRMAGSHCWALFYMVGSHIAQVDGFFPVIFLIFYF